jgi:DNA-binding CsgD family transcriptional regulator
MRRRTSLARGGAKSAKIALGSLCERGLDSRSFGRELRRCLLRLLAFDGYCLNRCDPESGIITSSVGDGLNREDARALFALEAAGGDVNCLSDLRRGPTHVASLSLSTGGQPEQSQRMRLIFAPLGFTDELRAALRVERVCYGYLHLFRGPGADPFSSAELSEVGAASPLLARALRSAASVARAASRSSVQSRPKPALLLLDGADKVLRQSPGADAVLDTLSTLDALRVESGLSHLLHDVASRARSGAEARATLSCERAAPLSVSALPLGAETAIVIDEASARSAEALNLSSFALTGREREVSRAVALGRSNQSIAKELGISLHTVKDHVKSILAKTRCATRSELAARLRGVLSA